MCVCSQGAGTVSLKLDFSNERREGRTLKKSGAKDDLV